MSDELMHFFTRNMAKLRKETFVDQFGKRLKVLDSTERVMVLLQYLNHANTEHLSYPGSTKLAEETGLDRRNVRDSRDDLVRAGWLTPAGSVNYQGVQSQALPGVAKKGRKSGTKAYRITLPGMGDELPLGVAGGVLGGVTGGVSITPQTRTETKTPPQTFSESSGQRHQAKGGSRKEETPAAVMAARLVERDLADRPPAQPAGPGLKRKKQGELLPICEEVLALCGAAYSPAAADRVALAKYRNEKPAKFDLAALQGREPEVFRAADLPPVPKRTLDQLPQNVQEMLAATKQRKALRAG